METKRKTCSNCEIEKPLSSFNKNKTRKDGHEEQCRECRREYKRKYRESKRGREKIEEYYKENKDKERERTQSKEYKEYQKTYREKNKEKLKRYREENRDRLLELKREWYKDNITANKVKNNIYFAKMKGLEINWNEEDYEEMMMDFGEVCCLTGTEELHVDHFIAIETGHGGTYKGNMIPLSERLNQTKSNKNPFEWIKEQEGDIQLKFKGVVKMLALYNNLTLKEFKDFVYWCYKNKRTTDEVRKNGTSSLELWKQSRIKVL